MNRFGRQGAKGIKYRFDFLIGIADNLPVDEGVFYISVSRGSKSINSTKSNAQGFQAEWNETLSLVATMYKHPKTQTFIEKMSKLTLYLVLQGGKSQAVLSSSFDLGKLCIEYMTTESNMYFSPKTLGAKSPSVKIQVRSVCLDEVDGGDVESESWYSVASKQAPSVYAQSQRPTPSEYAHSQHGTPETENAYSGAGVGDPTQPSPELQNASPEQLIIDEGHPVDAHTLDEMSTPVIDIEAEGSVQRSPSESKIPKHPANQAVQPAQDNGASNIPKAPKESRGFFKSKKQTKKQDEEESAEVVQLRNRLERAEKLSKAFMRQLGMDISYDQLNEKHIQALPQLDILQAELEVSRNDLRDLNSRVDQYRRERSLYLESLVLCKLQLAFYQAHLDERLGDQKIVFKPPPPLSSEKKKHTAAQRKTD